MAKDTGTAASAATTTKSAPSNGETDHDKPKAKIEDGKEIGGNQVDLNAARDDVQKRQDKLNEENEEGHAKNMEAIEHAHRHVEDDRSKSGSEGGEDRIGGADPKLGREDNGNTPRIAKDGSKSWHPPGVVGARVPS